MTTADSSTTFYAGQPAKHWLEMARNEPDTFLKVAGNPLLAHDDPWIANAYHEAALQKPVHAFMESASFAHRTWAKDILVGAAKQEPGAAFELFNNYAYTNGKPTQDVSTTAENAPRAWAKDVLVAAAKTAPEKGLAFCENAKEADNPWISDIRIVAAESLPVTRGHGRGMLRALAERRERVDGRGGAAL